MAHDESLTAGSVGRFEDRTKSIDGFKRIL